MPLYKYALHGKMRTYRPKKTDDSILAFTGHDLPTGAEVLIAHAVIMTHDNRPQIALKIIDLEEPEPIDDLYLLAEEISPAVCTFVHEASSSFLCAIRRAATESERTAAAAHFNVAITEIGKILQPEVTAIADSDSEIPPGHSGRETSRPSFALFAA